MTEPRDPEDRRAYVLGLAVDIERALLRADYERGDSAARVIGRADAFRAYVETGETPA